MTLLMYPTGRMNLGSKDRIVAHINRKKWWHVPPSDPQAYSKRGKFLASSFAEAEFWGRPLDEPLRVTISNPVFGDEQTVQRELLGKPVPYPGDDYKDLLRWRWQLDARMRKAALAKGYDSIVVFSAAGFEKYKMSGKIPRSIELNILRPNDSGEPITTNRKP